MKEVSSLPQTDADWVLRMREMNAALLASSVHQHELAAQAKEAESALRDSEVRYRRLFQSAKDGILILDANTGKIIEANAFMSGLLGMERQDIVSKELFELGMGKDIEANKEAFRELRRSGYMRHDHLPMRNKRGEEVQVEFIANTYVEDDMLVAQCNVRDISERAGLEKQIKEQAQSLANQARRKDEFLAMLSHELRNPLAPIRSAVHLLKLHERGSENPIQQQAREVIERQVTNLTRLVSDLMEVSRAITGRIRLKTQILDLGQVVRHAVDTVMPLVDQRKHKLFLQLCDDAMWVSADPTRMEEVFINLLQNASKYTNEGGRIDVECKNSPDQNHVEMRVRDNGEGIDAQLLPEIFDLFTQADRTLDRSEGGLGIGLSLAHQLVALHGGTIEAKSPPDGESCGSEFIVRLPLATAPDELAQPRSARIASEVPEGKRVLVVDDNVDMVTMLAGVLRHKGYSVQSAHTGPDGVKVAHQWRPDIVLLDIGLPGLDGYEVARRLRADKATKGARIIAMTGYGQEADVLLAHEAGFDAHIVKPYDIDDLEKLMSAPRG